jgi:catabolite regulation protein CreA
MANAKKTQTSLQEIPIEDKIRDFSAVLDSISSLSSKKKTLWKEIYVNAIIDRNNASVLYTPLVHEVIGNETKHAIHAVNMAKYIEKMSNANAQLIKLAELIAEAEKQESEIDTENIYNMLAEDEK